MENLEGTICELALSGWAGFHRWGKMCKMVSGSVKQSLGLQSTSNLVLEEEEEEENVGRKRF